MDILHLTDLHAGPERGLLEQWDGLRSAFPRDQKFDFVVISGDLTDHGTPPQYALLHTFLRQLVKVLRVEHVGRIIMVPGNHDASWGARDSYIAAPASPPKPDQLADLHLTNRYRVEIREDSANVTHQILPVPFGARFAACQSALTEFYGQLAEPHRVFNLTSASPENHWSAHIFPDDGIAFFGFNSAFSTDYYWRGGFIPAQSISAARTYAERHAKGLLKVAVWHHGLLGPRGASDFVTVAELGDLANAGFELGIHGHTHRDELSEHLELPKFPVIATGSFTAIPGDRPDGVKNQASVLDLTPSYLRWRVFDRDANTSQWRRLPTREVPVRAPRKAAPLAIAKVGTHHRRVEIDNDGIATIHVRIDRLELTSDFPLASPSSRSPIDSRKGALATLLPSASPGSGTRLNLDVAQVNSNGRTEFLLRQTGETYTDIEWEYSLSNAFALDDVDLQLGPYRDGEDSLGLLEGQDAIAHTVRAHTDKLVLAIESPQSTRAWQGQIRVQRKEDNRWIEQADDAAEIAVVSSQRSVSVTVRHPRLGYRYILAYRTPRERPPTDSKIDTLVREVVKVSRDQRNDSTLIERAIEAAIRGFRDLDSSKPIGSWALYLWDTGQRLLLTSAGHFPPRSWGASFEYGSGVAGHAFRTVRPALFSRVKGTSKSGRDANLIYTPAIPGGALQEHNWLVCLPIVDDPKSQSAIGVVGFADYSHSSGGSFADWLRESAALICASDGNVAEEQRAALGALSHAISAAFWQSLGEMSQLSEGFRTMAATIYASSWVPPDEAPPRRKRRKPR